MCDLIPTRLSIGLMIMATTTVLYGMRSNMSVSILAMVQSPAKSHHDENRTMADCVDLQYGPRQNWSEYDQSLVLGAYFWGYAPSIIPLGILIDRYGKARLSIGLTTLIVSALTMLTPWAAQRSLALLLGLRFTMGFAAGGCLPAVQKLIAHWAPSSEKSRFVCTLIGTDLGVVLAWSLCGLTIESVGWPASFHGTAAIGLAVAVLWFYAVYDRPAEHPRISCAERDHIERNHSGANKQQPSAGGKRWPPFGEITRSLPFWVLVVGHVGHNWGMNVLMAALPRFMYEMLGFDLATAGVMSGGWYLVRMVSRVLIALVADWLIARWRWSRGMVQKGFVVFSHIMTGVCFLLIGWASHGPNATWGCVACIMASALFNGAISVTTDQNAHDLAPNYTGTLSAVSTAMSTTTGFMAPVLVAYVTNGMSVMDNWVNLFASVGLVLIATGALFMWLGSVEVQSWNEPKKPDII